MDKLTTTQSQHSLVLNLFNNLTNRMDREKHSDALEFILSEMRTTCTDDLSFRVGK